MRQKHRTLLFPLFLLIVPPAVADTNLVDSPEQNDNLGAAVATGDFNCDGYDDLAIGVPGEDFNRGAVNMVYGGTGFEGKLGGLGNNLFVQIDFTTFGQALAAGDFDNDGCDDLAVGFPGDNAAASGAGGVLVVYGEVQGIQTNNSARKYWSQNTAGIASSAQSGDAFGHALAAGDFNNDGFDDLAIGVPGESISFQASAGAVSVIYGRQTGLDSAGNQFIHQDMAGVPDVAQTTSPSSSHKGDNFGWSLAAGDFNGDGWDDLAVGVPGESFASTTSLEGAVNVFYGSGTGGLSATSSQLWHQDTVGVPGDAASREYFGKALTAGDFDGDGRDDLAIGIPSDNSASGGVNVLYGTLSAGLSSTRSQLWNRGMTGMQGPLNLVDAFGSALASGDINADGRDDLVVGMPFEQTGGAYHTGSMQIIYGSSQTGLVVTNNQYIHQDTTGVLNFRAPADKFGYALACGDFNNDGYADPVAGIPGETAGGASRAGAAQVFYGGGAVLNPGNDNIFYQ